jgi:hypothetical protein
MDVSPSAVIFMTLLVGLSAVAYLHGRGMMLSVLLCDMRTKIGSEKEINI